jgi:hypothetical protein
MCTVFVWPGRLAPCVATKRASGVLKTFLIPSNCAGSPTLSWVEMRRRTRTFNSGDDYANA